MKTGRIYVDTSAYLSLLLGEGPSTKIESLLRDKMACSSILLLIETERNLVRLAREKNISPKNHAVALNQLKEDRELMILRDMNIDLCLTGEFPAVYTPKTSDLIHLRTARWFAQNGALEGFLSLDVHQCLAARDFGLVVIEV